MSVWSVLFKTEKVMVAIEPLSTRRAVGRLLFVFGLSPSFWMVYDDVDLGTDICFWQVGWQRSCINPLD
jgi:hypothetical protein